MLRTVGSAFIFFLVSYLGSIAISRNTQTVSAPPSTTADSLPLQQTAPLSSPSPSPTSTPLTPTPQATPTPAPMASYFSAYTVQAGDTLRSIADQYDVSVRDIVGVNSKDSDNLQVGQELYIPSYLGDLPKSRKSPTIPSTATVETESGLNVRNAPSTTGSVQYIAPMGEELTLTGDSEIVNGIEWLKLNDGNWVQARYLYIVVRATVIPINGIGVLSSIERIQLAYMAPHGSILELIRPSPVYSINIWWQVIDGNWAYGEYLDFY